MVERENDIRQAYYDIESLNNVFSLCNYKYNENVVDVYVLCDDRLDTAGDADGRFCLSQDVQDRITAAIRSSNKNFTGSINYFDLSQYDANLHLITDFGAKDDNGYFEKLASEKPNFSMFVNDTDAGYSDKQHTYLSGYNSFNYDTTMLALWISETFWVNNGKLDFKPPTARAMRDYNNQLFTPKYKERMPSFLQRNKDGKNGTNYGNRENIIRNNMIRSGRYIDVAQLNEKMQKVALKRVLGMLGHQILESNKISATDPSVHTLDDLADLLAYNVSDVVNLREMFVHPVYQGNFELKKGLLEQYPELVYNKKADEYAPDIRPGNARRDRLYIDSSSAKLAARALCPYGILHDIETVSFMYPSEAKAKELGIPRVNVLDECRKFFHDLFPDKPEILAEFERIYRYYKDNIEGRNFNSSDEYADYYKASYKPAYDMDEIPKFDLTLPYYTKDGEPSKCYVVFGVGGIHGAEYNKTLYDKDLDAYLELKALHDTVRAQFPDPIMLKQKDPVTKKAWSFEYNGKVYKSAEFLKSGSTAKKAEWKDISKKCPQLFKQKTTGGWELSKRYAYTSAAPSNHEDFTSYYPNMLIMLQAFLNEGLGYDRYAEIFNNKQKYGKMMKDPNISDAERYHYDILRNGTKLVLNSASGAADAKFFTPIRMNNQIMSMRIIGQLFTWRIGQAQTYEGADIISTNTDGLFSVFEPVKNAEILEREAANINVAIEPEYCYLVSKDSNNRAEIDKDGKIINASGSIACYKGPNPTKSLAHAAIIDWALCEYFRNVDNIHRGEDFMSQPFDLDKGRVILYNSRFAFPDKVKYLLMFQTIIASSIGSQTYIFGETQNFKGYKPQLLEYPFDKGLFDAACNCKDINIMQHYNRIFFVKDDFNKIYGKPVFTLQNASARAVTPAQKLTRQKTNQLPIQHDPYALALLEKFGLMESEIPFGKEAKINKVSGIDPEWLVYIENHSLFELSDDEIQLLIDNLDMDKYLTLLSKSFNKNWCNADIPSETDDDLET